MILFNPSLYERSVIVKFDVKMINADSQFRALFNGEAVQSYTSSPLRIAALEVTELKGSPTIHIEIPRVQPLSANLVTVETVTEGTSAHHKLAKA